VIYPQNFEEKIGFDKIREMLTGFCLSSLGQEKVKKIRFSSDYEFLKMLLDQVAEFRDILLMGENFPVSYYFDVTQILRKIEVEGAFPEIHELFDIKRSLETIRAIIFFFKNSEEEKYPNLKKLVSRVGHYPYIHERVNRILTSHGRIKDNASPELQEIRKEILSKQGSISKTMARLLKQAQSDGFVEDDMSPAIREGRVVIPVPASYKRKINGIIHDESATGKTVYIEPSEIVGINNQIRELEIAEKREIVKILMAFAIDVRPYIPELLQAYDFLGIIDLIRAKAKFALQVDARKPLLVNKQFIQWRDAKHPLLYLALKKENKDIVPLSIKLNPSKHILLISGPNAGGKSVCLKTVGMLQYMLQCGMLVPALENSEFGIFKQLFIDIGDEQSIENDLSTYSSHLNNMKHFTKFANQNTLVLIDEFGTGTEPMLGGAIAEAVLEELTNCKAFGVITTHYANLKHFASSAKGVENGAMMFDTHKIEPLFKLEVGRPGSSFAFEIARKIGLSEKILKSATDKVGEEHIDFEKHLREILRDKKYIEEKRDNIRRSDKNLQKILEEYSHELKDASKLRKEILAEAKQEAKAIVDKANKEIENTIRKIKEAQAEKEKTKIARKEFEGFKDEIENFNTEEEGKIRRKIEKLKNREKKLKAKTPEDIKTPVLNEVPLDKTIEKGSKVKMVNQNTVGEVIEIQGKKLLVAFGNLITSVEERKLVKISDKEYKKVTKHVQNKVVKLDWEQHEKNISFKAELDVRGKRTDEALQLVQEFVDQAYSLNNHTVKILHGKGNGILRHMIREYLRTFDVVKSCRDEDVRYGGSGITIVEIE